MVQEHLLGQGGALTQGEQLEHLVFLAGQMHPVAVHLHCLGVEVDGDVAGLDHRLGMALGAADHRVDAGHQFVLVERLGHVVVGAAAQGLHLGVDLGRAGQDHDRGVDLGHAQLAQHVHAGHVGQIEVQQDQVVIVDLAEIDAFLAQVGRIDVEALRLEHQLDALRGGAVVLDQQYAHQSLPTNTATPKSIPARPQGSLS